MEETNRERCQREKGLGNAGKDFEGSNWGCKGKCL